MCHLLKYFLTDRILDKPDLKFTRQKSGELSYKIIFERFFSFTSMLAMAKT